MANRDIIVIGGSTGSIEVLRTICGGLSPDLPAAILVVVHLAPESGNRLASILDAAGPLPAATARDGEPIERGRIYVAPADQHMLVLGGAIALRRGPRENLFRPAVDPLFRSAALSHGARVIGLVLSGQLNDGAAGLVSVKACGGSALVQDPAEARAPEMPRSALQAVEVDRYAPAAELAALLGAMAASAPGPARPVPQDLHLEVNIAADGELDSERLRDFAEPVPLTCPDCGGVLSQTKGSGPLRFRCQIGHAFTGQALDTRQESAVDEALRVALRIVEERVELLRRLCEKTAETGLAARYASRADEYRAHAQTIRRAIVAAVMPDAEPADL
ncbi:chemotaxis protein CheB [Methylobacterium soli]|uniref:protein-glutamate methylesterase n=1 Tax=Methylobacterium soli TaxID=553447 RepID=A0A6L3STH3_9HYPH|nr:chemotaxis protein CheB [Methylobacterium soli]KAB1076907.1 chemotaxis protein CheB [Methylobacterium soli]GJE42609.1 Protein-glutamate methylesterase/protein-glutamine glutaminase [Methylobacterium soli]